LPQPRYSLRLNQSDPPLRSARKRDQSEREKLPYDACVLRKSGKVETQTKYTGARRITLYYRYTDILRASADPSARSKVFPSVFLRSPRTSPLARPSDPLIGEALRERDAPPYVRTSGDLNFNDEFAVQFRDDFPSAKVSRPRRLLELRVIEKRFYLTASCLQQAANG